MNKIVGNLSEFRQQIILVKEENLNDNIEQFSLPKQMSFKAKDSEFFQWNKEEGILFLVGLGKKTELKDLQKITQKFSLEFKDKLEQTNTLFHFPTDFSNEQKKQSMIGFFKGTYKINKEVKDNDVKTHALWSENLSVSSNDPKDVELFKEAQIIVEGQFLGMDLLNLPPNKKHSEILNEFVSNLANDLNVDFKSFNKQECEELGLTSFLSVNQGSAYEPAFMILEYKPENANKKIGFIGKCVTFDTGGISIKPSNNMHYMKSDMGGATTVLGAFLSIVKLKLPVHLVAILPATDNAVNNNSYLPGDVIPSYSGKTIEVINTDAEGRMTLADALSYMEKNYKPDVMIDLATLTGSSVRALGGKAAALFSSNTELETKIRNLGAAFGEKTWPMPLWDEYLEDLDSDVADLKHLCHTPVADVIYAAKFLQQFTNEHPNWAHLDIAGVAFGNNSYSKEKSATGYGVQLLVELCKRC